jgi:hypothetical protein
MDLQATAGTVDRTLAAQFSEDCCATAVLAELDLAAARSGRCPPGTRRRCSSVTAGPSATSRPPRPPLRVRRDTVVSASLQPSVRVLLFSDGVVEARSLDGEFLGTARLVDLLAGGVTPASAAGDPPPAHRGGGPRPLAGHAPGRRDDPQLE